MKALVLLLMMFPALLTFGQNRWEYTVFGEVTWQAITVDHMPYDIRNVPIHKDDGYVSQSNAGPISRETYSDNWFCTLGIEMRDNISANYRFNIKLSLFSFGNDDMAERNYTNAVGTDERGEGAALTYCELHEGGLIAALGYSSTMPFDIVPEISLERKIAGNLLLGVSVSYFTVTGANGWDRWDAYEENQSYLFAHCFPIIPYLRLDGESVTLSAGPSFSNIVLTDAGKAAGLKEDKIGVMVDFAIKL